MTTRSRSEVELKGEPLARGPASKSDETFLSWHTTITLLQLLGLDTVRNSALSTRVDDQNKWLRDAVLAGVGSGIGEPAAAAATTEPVDVSGSAAQHNIAFESYDAEGTSGTLDAEELLFVLADVGALRGVDPKLAAVALEHTFQVRILLPQQRKCICSSASSAFCHCPPAS